MPKPPIPKVSPIKWDSSEDDVLRSVKALAKHGLLNSREHVQSMICHPMMSKFESVTEFLYQHTNTNTRTSNSPAEQIAIIDFLIDSDILWEWTVLADAIEDGRLEVVKHLIERGIKISDVTFTVACGHGQINIVKFLIEYGMFITSDALASGIAFALKYNEPDIIQLLIEKGACLDDIATKKYKYAALDFIFGTPVASIKRLTQDDERHLPALLQRLFDKTKVTPYDYLLTCPEWHKPYVMDIIAGN